MIANFVKEKTNIFLTILILLLTLIVLFSIILASFFGYPIAMGDKEGFYPVIFNLFEKNQFIHPFLCHLCENYVSNWSNKPWTNHGFLYPTLLSKFIIFNEYERVELTVIFFLIFNLFFCMKIILDKSINSYLIYIVFFALNLFQVGRPELLVTTVLLIDLYFSKKNYFNLQIVFISLFSALIFCISPVCAIIYYFYLHVKNYQLQIKSSFYLNPLYYLYTFILVIIIFHLSVSEFSFLDWLNGIFAKRTQYTSILNKNFFSEVSFYEYWTYMIKGSKYAPANFLGYIIIFLILYKVNNLENKTLVFFILGLSFLIFWFGIRRPVFHYNTLLWVNFVLMFVLFNRKINSKFIQSLLYLFSTLCLVSIIIFSILLPLHTIAEGVSVKYLKNSLNQIPSNKNVILPKQFFMFSTKTKNIKMFKNPYTITSNEIKGNEFDYVYLHRFEVLNFVTNGIPSIKNYCLDEKKINKSKLYNLYDYSYIKYIKC